MARLSFRAPWALGLTVVLATALGAGLTSWQSRVAGEEAAKTARDSEAIGHAKALSHAFRYAAEDAGKSVVKIRSHTNGKKVKGFAHTQNQNPFKGTPFEDMFPNGLPNDGQFSDRTPERDGVGSGVIIDKSGIVLTNNHVVEGADELTVTLADGREFKATDIKTDPQTDLAVIRLEGAKDLPVARLGNSDEMEIGDWVIAIGSPFELDQTVSAGIISSKGREVSSLNRARFLQTDAAINPGNSGGPLVNLDGDVIGINTAIATNSGGYQGIGFSIPINTAKWVTTQLIDKGKVARGYLGIQLEEIGPDLAGKLGVHKGDGVLVADVMPNTPAAAAGVKEGDVITAFSGTAVHGPRDLRDLVEKTAVDSKQTLTVNRDGKQLTVDISVKAFPDSLAGSPRESNESLHKRSSSDTYQSEDLGLEVANMTADETETYKGYEGVVVRQVEDGSPAAHKGLEAGMLIRKVGKTPVKNVEEFAAALKHESLTAGVMFEVRTATGNHFVVLRKA